MANYLTRCGYSAEINESNFEKITKSLVEELRTEEHDEPDDEHTQVSVGNEHWSITAQVSGLITFDNIDILEGVESELPESMYLRNISDAELVRLWWALVQDNVSILTESNWCSFEELPAYEDDFYRAKA